MNPTGLPAILPPLQGDVATHSNHFVCEPLWLAGRDGRTERGVQLASTQCEANASAWILEQMGEADTHSLRLDEPAVLCLNARNYVDLRSSAHPRGTGERLVAGYPFHVECDRSRLTAGWMAKWGEVDVFLNRIVPVGTAYLIYPDGAAADISVSHTTPKVTGEWASFEYRWDVRLYLNPDRYNVLQLPGFTGNVADLVAEPPEDA